MQSIFYEQTILASSQVWHTKYRDSNFHWSKFISVFFNLVLMGYLDNFSFLFVPQISLYNHCYLIFNVLITKHFYGAASFFTYHSLLLMSIWFNIPHLWFMVSHLDYISSNLLGNQNSSGTLSNIVLPLS